MTGQSRAGRAEEGEAAACGAFADALQRFRLQRIKVGGRSMMPAVWPGDEVEIEAADLRQTAVGDVVACLAGSRLLVHRLVCKQSRQDGTTAFVTRGDGLDRDDAPLQEAAMLGRVRVVRRARYSFDPARRTPISWRVASWAVGGALAGRQWLGLAWHRAVSAL